MKWLKKDRNLDDFFKDVAQCKKAIIITDYDGTIAPHVFERERAKLYSGMKERLTKISLSKKGKLFVVSGSPVKDLQKKIKIKNGVELWGTHGWEQINPKGEYQLWPVQKRYQDGLVSAQRWCEIESLESRMEIKPATIAVHWRAAGESERVTISTMATRRFKEIADESGLLLHFFDCGIELRTPGRDKGVAVATIVEEIGENTSIVCIGDDNSDEDSFSELGDRALKILVNTEQKKTAADLWLRPPRELLTFFDRWLEAVNR
jgi:trehalose 6-phosphate phosphatase